MPAGFAIRESVAADLPAIRRLYAEAFPVEDLQRLVTALLRDVPEALSLVAAGDEVVVGHILFTPCQVAGSGVPVALLGPLAIDPRQQRRGIGGALIRDGLRRLEAANVGRVLVLGDPAYYGRFGFTAEADILPPYPLPREWAAAWQSIGLGAAKAPVRGTLSVPQPWRQPALWA